MHEWNIQSRAHACSACAQGFVDKQTYRTVLFEEAGELRRTDICEACAKAHGNVKDRPGFISYWQGVYEAPPPPTNDAIQKETAETILRKLTQANDPKYAPAAYILAVMLERKRLLKVKEQIRREGQRIFVYEQTKTGDIFTITDPNLHLSQLAQVQQDVSQLLEHGLPADPNTVTPPVTEAAPSETSATVTETAATIAPDPAIAPPAAVENLADTPAPLPVGETPATT
ncbi:MAG TPA: hypothetical protein VF607_11225 [Verrucomicrobiae bacterium]